MNEVEVYYILGNKISIKKSENLIVYEIEEVKLTPEEEKIANKISEKDNVYKYNLDPTTADKILYYLKKKKFGKLTLFILDDRVKEVSYFGNRKLLQVYLEGYGWATTNMRYESKEELLSDFKRIFGENVVRRRDQLILSDENINVILNASNENLAFNLIKNEKRDTSITQLLTYRKISIFQAALLWEIIEKRAFLMVVGNYKEYRDVISSILNLLQEFKILNITNNKKLNLINDKYFMLSANSILITDTRLYNPDVIIVDKISKKDIIELMKLNLENRGIIWLTDFPDYYSFFKYLGKGNLMPISRLFSVIFEVFGNAINIYVLTSKKNKLRLVKITSERKLPIKLDVKSLKEKQELLSNLVKDEIFDSSIVYNKIREKVRGNASILS